MTDQLAEPGIFADTPASDPVKIVIEPEPGDQSPDIDPEDGWWSKRRARRKQRVPKWDRPPEPRDWRFFVGHLGRILISTGLLLFGFVAYQLWGTGIETARAQASLESEFEQMLAQVNDPAAAGATDGEGDSSTNAGDSGDAVADGFVPQPQRPTLVDATDDPTMVQTVPDLVASDPAIEQVVPAEEQNLPPVVPDQAIMRVEIPKIGVNSMVLPGVTRNDLKKGPGHFPDTPLPGQLGNAALAGHRTTYGAPFNELDELEPGDRIEITRIDGNQYVYEVTGTVIVNPEDYYVVTTTDPTVAMLTLTTCHPEATASHRMAVSAVLIPEESGPVGEATFYEGFRDPTTEVIDPADDPTFVQPEADADDGNADTDAEASDDPTFVRPDDAGEATDVDAATNTATDTADDDAGSVEVEGAPEGDDDTVAGDAPSESGGESTSDAEVSTANDDAAATTEPITLDQLDGPPEHIEDAFSEGWFDDDQAWSQIALWGAALTLISLLAYTVSRKTRHDSIGFLVGIMPFMVALYFFYQNVNRLLPAGL